MLLRHWFGVRSKDAWQELARQIGGDFSDGGLWHGNKVQAHVNGWTITLDTYVVSAKNNAIPFTRLRAPYVNPDGFRFEIYRASLLSDFAGLLGAQDVRIGHELFDKDYVIKGSDEAKLRALFASERLRQLIADQPKLHLVVKDDEGWFGADFPKGVDELRFSCVGIITDVERLKGLFDIFAETSTGCAASAPHMGTIPA